ncbi:ABC transporter permease [Bacteroidia bacterium]|nr:ABC transporter permease [Bacteroidia bacterium]GHT49094.1 ABC transporter permease [Bacteroidia bacterium]
MKTLRILKIAMRSLMHYKLYSAINILGLAMSLTCVIIISRYVYSELTVDTFNRKLDRIYITTMERSAAAGQIAFSGIFNPNNEKTFVDLSEHSGVEKRTNFIKMSDSDMRLNNQIYNTDILAVDSSFLQIVDFQVIAGANNIIRPEDALISEPFAKKVFGKENPIGQKLYYPLVDKELTITGVIEKPHTKSSISFDMLVSSQLSEMWSTMPQMLILLYPEVNYEDINKQHSEFMEMSRWSESIRYQLYPYKNIYFENKIINFLSEGKGNFLYVIILSVVGILLLLIGIINYINIYTVVILRRNKEFGMKKVFGAEGFKIFYQLLFENGLLIVASMILALGFAELLSPVVQNIFGFEQFPHTGFTLLLVLLLLFTLPLLTSITPFLRYHYASPVRSLRAVNTGGKSLFSRQFFLCFQYFITMVMIAVSLFFVKQLHFMLHQDLGYRTQNIIKAPFQKDDYNPSKRQSDEEWKAERDKKQQISDEIKQKLDASTLFEHWTWGRSPNESSGSVFDFKIPGGEFQSLGVMNTDETWVKLFDIQLLEGRLWDNSIDKAMTAYDMIVSESTLKQYGITDYKEVELEPSRRLWWHYDPANPDAMKQNPPYHIVGVVKDFYPAHLSQKQNPISLHYFNGMTSEPIIASFAADRRKEVIEFMKNLHDELIGGEFTYSFVEDEVAEMYKEDKKVAIIYSVFTVVAIFISILGLFGLSLFDIQQRRKEIAIRKVNGALTKEIIRLLLNKYFILLGIGFAISVPVALFAIHKYLENFAVQAPVSWWLFAIALFVTAAVSLLTLIYQTHKASNENPAEVLKSE